ncbi:TonB-dependent receptor [Sulfurimonas sp.]|uniref:TonB-dependent receptor n=1 Tax=Sulfurimonas sp. TaxID=2022749 RepID=UPI002636BAF2|nr:TonB-dependent receptor [Sulfurimonas sp.]
MNKTIQLSLLSVALLSQLHANETVQLAPLSITSTAIATDELKSTDAVEVYTAKDIEKAHVQNIYEFLNQQTSVISMPSYGNPYSQLIDIHGYGTSNGNQNVVITVNGRKLNNIDNAPQLLSSISPASISKIEIIKSSGIVVGGDGANAAVINITTKQTNEKEVSFYMGNYGLVDGSFYVGHTDEKFSISASAEAQKSDGIRTINAAGAKDENKFSTGTFNLSYTPTDTLELRLGANFSKIDVIYASYLTKAQYDSNPKQQSTSFFPVTHQKLNTSSLNGGITYYISDALSLNVDTSHEYKDSDYIPSYGMYAYNYNTAKASIDYETKTMALSIGYDGFFGDRRQAGSKTTKNNNALFAMSQFYHGAHTFKAGYRIEKISYAYITSTQNLKDDELLHGAELGYNYTLDNKSSLFANYSHSYQAPVIDMFFATTYPPPTYIPTTGFNGFIDPMQANNYTIGYNNIQKDNKFKISAYYIDLKNEIYLHKPDYKNTNIDKSHKYGVDIYDKYLISQEVNIALNYNYVQAIIDEEKEGTDDYAGNELPGVSNHNIKATLNYLPNRYATLALTQVYRSEAYAADDFNNNFAQKQDAYNSTDISATYAKDNWEIFAKINNLFNQKNGLWIADDAIYPVNFTTTGFIGLKLKY